LELRQPAAAFERVVSFQNRGGMAPSKTSRKQESKDLDCARCISPAGTKAKVFVRAAP